MRVMALITHLYPEWEEFQAVQSAPCLMAVDGPGIEV
jgi:hypothetical protein